MTRGFVQELMDSPINQLRALITAIVPGNKFYTRRLAADGVTGSNLQSLEDFAARVSFTRKQDLVGDQAAHPLYGSNLTYPLDRYTRFCQTTGTTGRPLIWLDTQESWDGLLENWGQIYRAARVGPGDRIYFAFSFGPFLGFWTAFEAAAALGVLSLPGGGLSSVARLQALISNQANVLLCTPTYALHLAEVASSAGIDLAESVVAKIIVAGEPGGSLPSVRERISKAWNGAQVIDHYGMTEVGPVTFQDPVVESVQRIVADSYYAEVIDPLTGASAASGTVGELVLTPLRRLGMPLLRYRTGDLVRACTDAQGLALRGGILGRADDMIVVRGVNLYPSAIDAVVRLLPEITEYRVRVARPSGTMAEVELEIESVDDGAASKLQLAFSQAFSLRIPVRSVGANTLPRFEFKARRWLIQE